MLILSWKICGLGKHRGVENIRCWKTRGGRKYMGCANIGGKTSSVCENIGCGKT